MSASPQVSPRIVKKEPTPAPKAFGRFELIERIGVGGMAEVFRAEVRGPEGFKRELVVKRVLPHLSSRSRFTQMFVNEAKISALLNHPNIVQIFEFGESDGSYFIAMESVRGLTLREALTKLRAREGVMPVVAAMEIAREILMALDYAHNLRDPTGRQLDIVHRDISPSNVMLADNGAVKVLDFGIARAADLIEENDSKMVKGKIAYLAPEQISLVDVDARVDVFAVGCVLSEMLTGRLLFRAQNDIQKKLALLAEPSLPPSAHNIDVPPAVDAIVLRAVARSPESRYDSAADMLIDIENYLSSFRSASRAVLRLIRSLTEPSDGSEPSQSSTSTPDSSQRTGPPRSGPKSVQGSVHGSVQGSVPGSVQGSVRLSAQPSALQRTSSYGAPHPGTSGGGSRSTASMRPPVASSSTSSAPVSARLEGAGQAEGARVDRRNNHRRWAQVAAGILACAALFALSLGARALVARVSAAVVERARVTPARKPTPAPPPFVLVTFVVRPVGSRILEAKTNRLLGTAPATLPITQALTASRFRFEKEGYAATTVGLTPDADKTVNVALKPSPQGSQAGARRKVTAR